MLCSMRKHSDKYMNERYFPSCEVGVGLSRTLDEANKVYIIKR